MTKDEVIRFENYDEEKAYIGYRRFDVVIKDRREYLLEEDRYNYPAVHPDDGEGVEAYRILKISNHLPDEGEAIRVNDKSLLADLVRIHTEDNESLPLPPSVRNYFKKES